MAYEFSFGLIIKAHETHFLNIILAIFLQI
jgi:hypothetical protein